MSISVDNIVTVSTTILQSGLQTPNVNSLALFSTETPNFIDTYRIYGSSKEVELDFGTNSITKQMADAIFSQNNNVLTGRGRLVIIPMQNSVSATSSKVQTLNLTTNLAALKLVTSGDLRITSNGINYDVIGIDLSKAVTLNDIADLLQKKVPNVLITSDGTTITFTSKKVGLLSTISVIALPSGANTNLAISTLLNTANAITTAGTNALGETLVSAIARVQNDVQFKTVITNLEMEDAVILATAPSIQSQKYIFIHHFVDLIYFELNQVPDTIRLAKNNLTRCLAYTKDFTSANLMKSAYASLFCSVNFAGNLLDTTMNLKSLITILPDNNINLTLQNKAKIVGLDLYYGLSESNTGAIYSSQGNYYADVIRSEIALSLDIQYNVVNALITTNTKIPQTNEGMQILINAVLLSCRKFVNNGVLAAGTWNGQTPFGDGADFKRNITTQGFYIYQDSIALQPQIDRENRIAPQIYIAVKLAGAVHTSTIGIVIQQ
jgi:hypothetical protein